MKRLLFISHSSEITGGAELELFRLLKLIKSEYSNIDIDCLIPQGPAVNRIMEFSENVGIYKYGFLPVVYRNIIDYFKYIYISIFQLMDISKFIKNKNIDLCVFNVAVLIIPAVYLKLRGFKNVFLIKEKVEPKLIRFILYKLIKYSSVYVFFNSKLIKEDYVKMTSDPNVMQLYTSVDSDSINSDNENNKDYNYNKFNLNRELLHILCVGDITERKNQLLLIKALHNITDQRDKYHTHFIGKADENNVYFKECQKAIDLYNIQSNVTFYGRLKPLELSYLFKKIDILCICSNSEGIPYVLFDALKYGKIVVSTNVGGISEIIINNENGYLIPTDSAMLTEKLIWLLNNVEYLNDIRENAKKTYSKYLNSNNQMMIMINKLIELSSLRNISI